MKLSENWLREWVDPGVSREALCERLDMIGLEVESVTVLGAGLEHVVVGEIVAAEPHPGADKLRVCRVDAGAAGLVQIVCGAPNARVGLKAPLALPGAQLANGMAIAAAQLRGVDSQGMLCSARELGLDADASGLMELPADTATGAALAGVLGLPDAQIELGLTPNRADCLGMAGLASDVAASFDRPCRAPAMEAVPAQIQRTRTITLPAADAGCPRFVGRVIEGVAGSARSPLWLAERLRRAGIRPISAVVDVTAYVMLELGQPMHAYDDDRLHGDIAVRRARAQESVALLDGRTVEVGPEFLVVTDANGAVGLGGIMGGLESRVTDGTTTVFLEAAHFTPQAMAGRARRLGLHTDASHRFERGVDPDGPRRAVERATALLLQLAGGRPGPVVEASDAAALRTATPVSLRRARIARLLGVAIADGEVERILRALDMQVTASDDGWQVLPPSRRFDIAIEEDLIEEVARIHGYDAIPGHAPSGELAPTLPSETRLADQALRRTLAARDWQEAITFAFVDPSLLATWGLQQDTVALANPLSAELAVMRPSLLPGLVQALAYNRARQAGRVRLFEIGRSFRGGAEAGEHDRLALVATGPAQAEHWDRAATPPRALDFHDLKGDLEALLALGGARADWQFEAPAGVDWLHPGRSARVLRDGVAVGVIGALHPALRRALDLESETWVTEVDLAALRIAQVPTARPLSRFPSVRRDIAVIVAENLPYAALAQAIRETLGERLDELVVFDEYRGPGLSDDTKSIAIGLILRHPSRTLTDEDADRAVTETVQILQERFHAVRRG